MAVYLCNVVVKPLSRKRVIFTHPRWQLGLGAVPLWG